MSVLLRSSRLNDVYIFPFAPSLTCAGLLLTFLLTSAAGTGQASAQVRATCETQRDDVIHKYVERTRNWSPSTYQLGAVASRGENEMLATYRIAPERRLQLASHAVAPFEVYLDLKDCRVVGEYVYWRERIRLADQSGEGA
ncbi:MAG: hypothetical protein RBS88_07595 [Spongiibacteraceae bacterium]|jgi:hypothetical protein|nr:hypothetical protein [Spongiibacteraceae bacterium]